MPPLLKTLSARSIYSVKKLVLLSKSEQMFGLGAGLRLVRSWLINDSGWRLKEW